MSAEPADTALFTYGALQHADVQLDIFGRRIAGQDDSLPGYTLDYVDAPHRAAADRGDDAGATQPVIRSTGSPLDRVFGRILWITEGELDAVDEFELVAFRRIQVPLSSGTSAWVYVGA